MIAKKEKKDFAQFDLTSIGPIKKLLKSRLFPGVILLPSLFIFVALIWAGFAGTPVGAQNAAIMVVWIFWFGLLAILLVPIGGRLWCLLCPLPSPGEWISRGTIVSRGKKVHTLGIESPKRLNNIWLQNLGFLAMASFSPIILTRPAATSIMLILFIVLAIALGLIFQRRGRGGRIFCRYVCPLGGFIGIYSLLGTLEVKSKDKEQCRRCREKSCSLGSEDAYPCPWFEYPGGMDRNIYCGLCAECIKACPHDNVSFRTRFFGKDLLKHRQMDEAFKSFIMLGSGLLFATIFFGWWSNLKDIADPLESTLLRFSLNWSEWGLYVLLVWGSILVVVPGIYLLFCWLAKVITKAKEVPLKRVFVDYAYALVPMGLAVWMAFGIGMLMFNGSLVISSISDPLGWGWDLFGTADYPFRPYAPHFVPFIQGFFLIIGLAGSTYTGWKLSLQNFGPGKALKAMLPIGVFLVGLTIGFMYVFAVI